MSLPPVPPPDDATLRHYLLGALTDVETERLDELSIVDDEFAGRLGAAEVDLVDAYVSGELAGQDIDRFESQYLATGARRAKVDFAAALRRYQATGRVQNAARAQPARIFGRLPAPHWLAAAATLILAAALYLLVDDLRLRRAVVESRAGLALLQERQRQLEQQLNTQQSVAHDAAQELARLRESQAAVPAPGHVAPNGDKRSVLAFVLMPAMRDASKLTEIRVSRGIDTVTLRLRLEEDDFPGYRATLKEANGARTIWSSAILHARPDGRNTSLSLAIDATLLGPTVYVVDVSGIPARGASESIATYPFRVVIE